jgi:hypothetical protein
MSYIVAASDSNKAGFLKPGAQKPEAPSAGLFASLLSRLHLHGLFSLPSCLICGETWLTRVCPRCAEDVMD